MVFGTIFLCLSHLIPDIIFHGISPCDKSKVTLNVLFFSSNRGTDICNKCWLFMVVAMWVVDTALQSKSCKSNTNTFKVRNFQFKIGFSKMLDVI